MYRKGIANSPDKAKIIGEHIHALRLQQRILETLENQRGTSSVLYTILTQKIATNNSIYHEISGKLPSLIQKYTNNIDGLYERYGEIGSIIRNLMKGSSTAETFTRQYIRQFGLCDKEPYRNYNNSALPDEYILSVPEIIDILFRSDSEEISEWSSSFPLVGRENDRLDFGSHKKNGYINNDGTGSRDDIEKAYENRFDE